MSKNEQNSIGQFFRIVLTALPWVVSMYLLYWLEYGEIWTLETPHRGKSSVIILLAGMSLSFFLYTRLFKRERKK